MDISDIKVPVYLVTGFLDAGKTSFLSFTIGQDYFQIDEKTLLIVCEEERRVTTNPCSSAPTP